MKAACASEKPMCRLIPCPGSGLTGRSESFTIDLDPPHSIESL
jgi:hypothetical protein